MIIRIRICQPSQMLVGVLGFCCIAGCIYTAMQHAGAADVLLMALLSIEFPSCSMQMQSLVVPWSTLLQLQVPLQQLRRSLEAMVSEITTVSRSRFVAHKKQQDACFCSTNGVRSKDIKRAQCFQLASM